MLLSTDRKAAITVLTLMQRERTKTSGTLSVTSLVKLWPSDQHRKRFIGHLRTKTSLISCTSDQLSGNFSSFCRVHVVTQQHVKLCYRNFMFCLLHLILTKNKTTGNILMILGSFQENKKAVITTYLQRINWSKCCRQITKTDLDLGDIKYYLLALLSTDFFCAVSLSAWYVLVALSV